MSDLLGNRSNAFELYGIRQSSPTHVRQIYIDYRRLPTESRKEETVHESGSIEIPRKYGEMERYIQTRKHKIRNRIHFVIFNLCLAEQAIKVQKLRLQQAETNAALQKQIDEIRERKLKFRRENLEEDREYLRQQQELDDKRLLAENEQRQKTIDYYRELGAIVDAQHKRTEGRINRIKGEIQAEADKISSEECAESVSPVSPKSVYHSAENLNVNEPVTECTANSSESVDDVTVTNENYKLTAQADFVNSNAEFTRNRTKALGSSLEFGQTTTTARMSTQELELTLTAALSDAQKNKLKVLQHDYFTDIGAKDSNRNDVELNTHQPLTDCQKNKMKVLGDEFNMYGMAHVEMASMPQIKVTQMSDLQRNRQKGMQHEFGRDALNLDLNSNSQKEIGGLTVVATDTPMSTGSDTPMIEAIRDDDVRNANNASAESAEMTPMCEAIPISCVLPNTSFNGNPTPESALNTAGVLAKDGFVFPVPPKPAQHDSRPPALCQSICAAQRPYQRFFSIDTDAEKHTIDDDKLFEMKSLDVTTISQHLQMSFVTPLQSYLNVLSNEVLKMYILDLDILSHFNSLRKYFFMLDGEFGSNISDKLIERLESKVQPNELFNYHVLHTILDQALGSSIVCNDVNSVNLSFNVDEIPEQFELKSPNVFKMLNLSYSVEWPLNLLLNSETISHYAKIFKYLLKLRRISWVLDKSFQVRVTVRLFDI